MARYEYGSAIKLTFDKPIMNEFPVVIGTEYYKSAWDLATFFCSYPHSSYPIQNVFDGNTSSMWMPDSTASGQYIGINFGEPKPISKIRWCSTESSSWRVNAYALQWSDNGVDWTTHVSGNFANSWSWTDFILSPALTHQYWRFYLTSTYSSYYGCGELQFYETRDTYDVSGWAVSGFEPFNSPEGALVPTTYTIRKITKADNDYSVILWLDLRNRMKMPQGQITVDFTGLLLGPESSFVAPFTVTFTPTNIDAVYSPNDPERIEVTNFSSTASLVQVHYLSYQFNPEMYAVTVNSLTSTQVLTNVDDLPE